MIQDCSLIKLGLTSIFWLVWEHGMGKTKFRSTLGLIIFVGAIVVLTVFLRRKKWN